MFGDNTNTYDLIRELLVEFTLEEIFEMNDLTDEEILRILIEGGNLGEPYFIIEKFEATEMDEDQS